MRNILLTSFIGLILAPGSDKETSGPAPKPVDEPSCGRIIHFFPPQEHLNIRHRAAANGAEKVPGVVIINFGLKANIKVWTNSGDDYFETEVPHKSIAPEGQAYWDWPEKK